MSDLEPESIEKLKHELENILYILKNCTSIYNLNFDPENGISNEQLSELIEYRINNLERIKEIWKILLNTSFTSEIISYLFQLSEEYIDINIYEINKDICWIYRKNYISLYEGFYYDKSHITKFLFNDLIMKEICSYMFYDI